MRYSKTWTLELKKALPNSKYYLSGSLGPHKQEDFIHQQSCGRNTVSMSFTDSAESAVWWLHPGRCDQE